MQNSSKKSSIRSRSQASRGGPQAPPPGGEAALTPLQKSLHEPGPEIPVRQPTKLPVYPGVGLIIEPRLITFLLLSFGLYVFAAFMANEWVYLLGCSFMIAAALGYFLPLLQILSVDVECHVPQEVEVNDTAEIKIHLVRLHLLGPLSRLLPVKALRFRMSLVRRGVFGQAPEQVLPPEPLYVESLAEDAWLTFPTPEMRRGVYFVDKVELMSCFPFGVVWWSRTFKPQRKRGESQSRLTVHPKFVDVSGNFLFKLKGVTSSMGLSSSSSVVVTQSTSVRGVREFKVGDSIRHIHWPSSARLGKLLVREFDSETLPVFDLLLDLRVPWKSKEQFELAVCLVHSLVHLGYKLGCTPELWFNPPLESKAVSTGLLSDMPNIPPGLDRLSEILSRVEPIPPGDFAQNDVEAGRSKEEEKDDKPRQKLGRPLLTVFPSSEVIMKYNPQKGDHMVYPIELAAIPLNWQDEDIPLEGAQQLQFKQARHGGEPLKRRHIQKTHDTISITTIDSEQDLEPL